MIITVLAAKSTIMLKGQGFTFCAGLFCVQLISDECLVENVLTESSGVWDNKRIFSVFTE